MSHRRLAYTTDLTDEEWQILEPLLPPEKSGGRPRTYPVREVMHGIQYVLRGGCAWRLMPHDLPHWPDRLSVLPHLAAGRHMGPHPRSTACRRAHPHGTSAPACCSGH
jgi:hypothetical protein